MSRRGGTSDQKTRKGLLYLRAAETEIGSRAAAAAAAADSGKKVCYLFLFLLSFISSNFSFRGWSRYPTDFPFSLSVCVCVSSCVCADGSVNLWPLGFPHKRGNRSARPPANRLLSASTNSLRNYLPKKRSSPFYRSRADP